MANPFTRGAVVTWQYGPAQSPDNFSSLAAGAARGLGVVNPGTPPVGLYRDIILPPWQITLAASPTTGGTIQRYLLFSEDNTHWPGNISPTSTSSQAAALAAAILDDSGFATGTLIDTITVQSGTTVYYTRWFSLYALIGNMASYSSVLVYNNTSQAFAAFSSNNQVAQYALDTYN